MSNYTGQQSQDRSNIHWSTNHWKLKEAESNLAYELATLRMRSRAVPVPS